MNTVYTVNSKSTYTTRTCVKMDTHTHVLQCAGSMCVGEATRELNVDVHVLVKVGVQLNAVGLGLVVQVVAEGDGPRTQQHEGSELRDCSLELYTGNGIYRCEMHNTP